MKNRAIKFRGLWILRTEWCDCYHCHATGNDHVDVDRVYERRPKTSILTLYNILIY